MKSFFYQQKNVEALLEAICGFLVVLLFTNYSGIGVSPDSVAYTSVARNLNAGIGMVEFSRKTLVEFPVMFPVFLGLVMFVSRLDPIVSAPYVTGFLFASVIFCSSYLIDTFNFQSKWYKYLILVAIIFSPSLLEIYTYLWSETLFILLAMLFLLSWQKYGRLHQQKWLLISAAIASISCITRYAGITLIGTGCLLLLFDPALKIKQKIQHGFTFVAVAVSLLLINLVRNATILGSLTGERQKSITPLSQNVYYFGIVISNWFTFPTEDYTIAFGLGLAVLTLFVVLFLWRSLNGSRFFSAENIIIAFFLVYALFIIISSSISRYETINNRLLAPAFIPFLVGITSWMMPLLKNIRQKKYQIIAVLPALLMLIFIYQENNFDHQRYEAERNFGIPGFTDDSWNKSTMVQFLKTSTKYFNQKIPIYSNAADAQYFFSGLPCDYVPDKHYAKYIHTFFSTSKFYLVWFNNSDETELLNLKEISLHKKVVLLKKFKEGAVYFCESISGETLSP